MAARTTTLGAVFLSFVSFVSADWGIVNLDNSTFAKVVDGTRPVLVRFDREYPYGEKHNTFKELAAIVAQGQTELLIGTVGIGTYGEKLNQDLAQRYGFKKAGQTIDYKDLDEKFPQYLVFPKGAKSTDKPVLFEKAVKIDEFLRFLKIHANVRIGLKGTLSDFDALAIEFGKVKDETKRKALLEKAETLHKRSSDKEGSEYYIKVMQRILEKGDEFVPKELKRLDSLQKSASGDKKDDFKRRSNILSAFLINESNDEL